MELALDGPAVTARSGICHFGIKELLATKWKALILSFGIAVMSLKLCLGKSLSPIACHHLAKEGN